MFYDHNGTKLEKSNRKESGKFTNMGNLSNILVNNQWVKDEIKKKIRKNFQINKGKHNTPAPKR